MENELKSVRRYGLWWNQTFQQNAKGRWKKIKMKFWFHTLPRHLKQYWIITYMGACICHLTSARPCSRRKWLSGGSNQRSWINVAFKNMRHFLMVNKHCELWRQTRVRDSRRNLSWLNCQGDVTGAPYKEESGWFWMNHSFPLLPRYVAGFSVFDPTCSTW